MKVLVTGGAGFIGSYMVDRLAQEGHEPVILDLAEPDFDAPGPAIRGDIRDREAVMRAMEGCEAVCHLAAAHHDFGIEENTFFSVNQAGTRTICDAMDAHGVRDICFYSTVAVYGEAPEPHCEDAPTKPDSPYGASKLAGEGVLRDWAHAGENRRALVIRPTVTFGARNFANMYTLIRQIHTGRFLPVGPGENIKSLSYIENIIDATMYLWLGHGRGAATDDFFRCFNYIDKPDLTSSEITQTVYKALGKRSPAWSVPLGAALLCALPFDAVIALTGKNLPISSARVRKLATVQTKFEADKLREAGYTAPVPLRDGIARMVEWYLREGKGQKAVWRLPPAEVVRAEDTATR